MAGNLYKRYVWLLDTISRRQGITFDEINRRWQYSALNDSKEPLAKRTFHNHIRAIYDLFDIEIGCPPKSGYRYYIMESGNINLRASQAALLNHLQISNAMFNNANLRDRIVMDRFYMWMHFSPLITAMDEGRAITITYRRADYGIKNIQRVTIEPYFIKQFESWFVVGRVPKDNRIHAFAFSSIRNIEITDLVFEMPKEFDVMEFIIQPQYNEPKEDMVDDSDLFILERSRDRIRRRSRHKKMYELAEGEMDYADIKIEQEELINRLHQEHCYRQKHTYEVTLHKDEDCVITLHSDKPNREPFINVCHLDTPVKIAIGITDGLATADKSKCSAEYQNIITQLVSHGQEWLNASCQEPHFSGTNRDYAQWMWEKLEM